MMARFMHALWLWKARAGVQRFRQGLDFPADAQTARLQAILARSQGCEFAIEHQIDARTSLSEFRRRVPIRTWDELSPWLKIIADTGRQGVLTQDTVTRLIPTAGSSGPCKLVPSGPALLAEFQAALEPWLTGLLEDIPSLRDTCSYWSVSPPGDFVRNRQAALPIGFEPDTRYFGPLGALMRKVQAVPQSLSQTLDMQTFRHKTLAYLLRREDLGFISVWHPSFLELLLNHLDQHWDDLLHLVLHGHPEWEGELSRGLSANAWTNIWTNTWTNPWASTQAHARARVRTLSQLGPRTQAIWPRLQAVSAWTHASSASAALSLAKRLPGVEIIPKGLAATEGMVSLPWKGHLPLAITSHFLEFLDEDGEVRLAHELEIGSTYEVVLTTSGGLWRMRTQDLVEVDAFCQATPCIRFLGRTSGTVDLCGEKLNEAFVARCFASPLPGLEAASWKMLVPREDMKGYVLLVDQKVADVQALTIALDSALSENPHYRLARQLGQLSIPNVISVAPSAQARVLNHLASLGQGLGIAKPPLLHRDPLWLQRLAS